MQVLASHLTFRDLILDVARKLGYAYYGPDGRGVAQIPENQHDLDDCKRIVNEGIRRFLIDSPKPFGWRWANPTAEIVLWATVPESATYALTAVNYDPLTDKTTVTTPADVFYDTMEEHTLTIAGYGNAKLADYLTPRQVRLYGNHVAIPAASLWSMPTDGNLTLPRTFGGSYTGDVTYAADSNRGVTPQWVSELTIRRDRESSGQSFGDPLRLAVRPMADARRRWELMVHPLPQSVTAIQFPYTLHFDALINLEEVPPAPSDHDTTIRAACLATAEQEVADTPGPDTAYYTQSCLPNSYAIDARTAPRRLGYMGNHRVIRSDHAYRPNVTVNT